MDVVRETPFQEHFTVQELADIWKISRRTVQRVAEKEPDIVRIGEAKPGVRPHFTLRIPAHVAKRIYLRLTGAETKKAAPEKKPPTRSLVKRPSSAC
jgi:hypothetical protein